MEVKGAGLLSKTVPAMLNEARSDNVQQRCQTHGRAKFETDIMVKFKRYMNLYNFACT